MSVSKYKKRLYYNVSIPHNDLISVKGSPTPAVYEEVRDQAIFQGSPKDWCMSVVRMTVPTSYIPIQFFPVEPDLINPDNPNKSIYSITLTYQGNVFQQFLEWIPQETFLPIPPPPEDITNISKVTDPRYYLYYSLYSFQHFCTLVNNALDTCFQTNIVPLLPAGTYTSPFLSFDGSTNLFTFTTSDIFLDSQANPVNVWFNTALNGNFDTSFDVEYSSFLSTQGENVRMVILDRGNNVYKDVITDEVLYKQVQDFDSTGQFTSFTSLIVRSVSLPIVNEIVSLQPRLGQIAGSGVAGGSEAIITDFEVDLGSEKNLRGFIHYIPTAEYRRITMHGNTPIKRIDIEILWKDNYDNLFPVLIPSHDIATVKILFETL